MTYLANVPVLDVEAILVLDDWALSTAGATVATDAARKEPGSLGVEKLLDQNLDTGFRTRALSTLRSSTSTFRVRYNLGRGRPVDTAVLVGSNVRVPWGVEFYRSNPETSSPVYASGWHDPVVRGRLETWRWREMPWTLGPSQRDLATMSDEYRMRSIIYSPTTYYGVQWVDLLFDIREDSRHFQATDYLQFGHCFLSHAFRPRLNLLLDWELGVDDLSEVHRVEAGGLLGRKRARLGTAAFTFGYLSRDEAYRKIFTQYMRRHGVLGRIFAWLEPHQPGFFYDQSMVCTASTLPAVAMANLNLPAARGWALTETE